MPSRPRFLTAVALLPVLALASGVAPAAGQPRLPRFELIPRAGVVASLVDLGKSRDPVSQWQVGVKLAPTLMAGLSAQYNPLYLPVSFRAGFDFAPLNAQTEAQLLLCHLISGPGCAKVRVDARYFVATVDAIVRAGVPERARFYLAAGVGIKWYDFQDVLCDAEDLVCNLLDEFTHDQIVPMVHLGVGLGFRVGPARLQVELADYMSTFRPSGEDTSGEVQQDLLLTLGVRLPIL